MQLKKERKKRKELPARVPPDLTHARVLIVGQYMKKRILSDAFEKYGWTPEQQKRFMQFIREKEVTNHNPDLTFRNYLCALN